MRCWTSWSSPRFPANDDEHPRDRTLRSAHPPSRHRVRHRARPHELPVSAAARHLPDQRSRVTETSDSEPLPTADQRNGRYDPLVFLAPLFLGGPLLLAMFFFAAAAVFFAALFLAPF